MSSSILKRLFIRLRSALWLGQEETPGLQDKSLFSSSVVFWAALAYLVFIIALSAIVMMTPGDYRLVPDFDVFHLAGQSIWNGELGSLYNPDYFQDVIEKYTGTRAGYMWMYPPPYAFIVAPLGALPRNVSYLVFILPSLALYLSTLRRLNPYHLSFPLLVCLPALTITVVIGQNTLLMTAIMAWLIHANQFVKPQSGIGLALLAMKPQLGLGPFVSVLIYNNVRAVLTGIFAAFFLVGLSVLVFGLDPWWQFLSGFSEVNANLNNNRFELNEFVSVYAFLKTINLPHGLALAIHALVVLCVLGSLGFLFHVGWPKHYLTGMALFSLATASPYFQVYDLAIVSVALTCLSSKLIQYSKPYELWILFALVWYAAIGLHIQTMAMSVFPFDWEPVALGGLSMLGASGLIYLILKRSLVADRQA